MTQRKPRFSLKKKLTILRWWLRAARSLRTGN